MPASLVKIEQHHLRADTDLAIKFATEYLLTMDKVTAGISEKDLRSLNEWLHGTVFDYDPEEIEEFEQRTKDRFENETIPAVRFSMVTYCHTLFETQIVRVCNAVRDEKQLTINVNDLRGSEIDRAKMYLSKIAGLQVSELKQWAVLMDMQKVRDCIIHQNGHVTKSKGEARLRAMDGKTQGYSIKDDRILLQFQFCAGCVIAIDELFDALFASLGWEDKIVFER